MNYTWIFSFMEVVQTIYVLSRVGSLLFLAMR